MTFEEAVAKGAALPKSKREEFAAVSMRDPHVPGPKEASFLEALLRWIAENHNPETASEKQKSGATKLLDAIERFQFGIAPVIHTLGATDVEPDASTLRQYITDCLEIPLSNGQELAEPIVWTVLRESHKKWSASPDPERTIAKVSKRRLMDKPREENRKERRQRRLLATQQERAAALHAGPCGSPSDPIRASIPRLDWATAKAELGFSDDQIAYLEARIRGGTRGANEELCWDADRYEAVRRSLSPDRPAGSAAREFLKAYLNTKDESAIPAKPTARSNSLNVPLTD